MSIITFIGNRNIRQIGGQEMIRWDLSTWVSPKEAARRLMKAAKAESSPAA